jgi:hypothetical protein
MAVDVAKLDNTPKSMRDMQSGLDRLERREWWRWSSALLIMLLLTLGVFSLSLPGFRREALTTIQLDLAVRGLFALVVVFDIFAIYQQILISRLRRQLAGQIGMMAALEAIKPAPSGDNGGRRERRRSVRQPFDQRVKIKTAGKEKEKENVFLGRIIDLSTGGMAAVLSGSLEPGEKVSLEFSLGVTSPTLTLSAVICYSHGFRHGFEFRDVSSLEAEQIRRACQTVEATIVSERPNPLPQAVLSRD